MCRFQICAFMYLLFFVSIVVKKDSVTMVFHHDDGAVIYIGLSRENQKLMSSSPLTTPCSTKMPLTWYCFTKSSLPV